MGRDFTARAITCDVQGECLDVGKDYNSSRRDVFVESIHFDPDADPLQCGRSFKKIEQLRDGVFNDRCKETEGGEIREGEVTQGRELAYVQNEILEVSSTSEEGKCGSDQGIRTVQVSFSVDLKSMEEWKGSRNGHR